MKQCVINFILTYLRFWAKIALRLHHPTIIGIAGSVGKSSTRHALDAVLSEYFPTQAIYGNSETGIPLGILGITAHGYSKKDWVKMLFLAPFGLNYLKGKKYLIGEMGIDDPYPPKNMAYLLTIIKPQIAVSLNVSATHTEQFEKALSAHERTLPASEKRELILQKIADEDTKIITASHCTYGIYNQDNEYIRKAIEHASPLDKQIQLIGFGTSFYKAWSINLSGTTFTFAFPDLPHPVTLHLKDFILPREYQENFVAVMLAAKQTGLSYEQIISSLEKNFTLPKGRASLFRGVKESMILDSSYNSSRAAVIAFLELVHTLKQQTKRPVVFLMGDMRELGDEAEMEHTALIPYIEENVDYLYCVGPLTQKYLMPHAENSRDFKETKWFSKGVEAGEYIAEHLPEKALVLVKGSQNTIFLEEAVKQLLANPKDRKKLCRQEEFWMEKKAFYLER